MSFMEEGKFLIKHYRLKKKYGGKKLPKEFPEKIEVKRYYENY